jgi:6-pyruvoyltetrahydropterin/6-carboxytetrahydropterin synthase
MRTINLLRIVASMLESVLHNSPIAGDIPFSVDEGKTLREAGMFFVRVEAGFSAAHFLKHYQGKCERLHGHNYKVRAWARGDSLGPGGMLFGFGELKGALRSVLEGLDHSLLNDMPEFEEDPSAERIAEFVFKALALRLPEAPLHAVEVFETETSMARYEP